MYHDFYGLRESPFGLTPDPKYLFATEAHKEALAHIAYGIEERRGFVLILGEVGTGKTTLIRHVLRRFGPDIKSVFVFNSNLDFEELLQAVLRDLEVPIPSRRRVDLIDALNEHLLKENAAGRRVVLIIDEAQHLSASVLEDIRMLSNLETARSKLLQIVLVGQPELGARLGQPNLRQLRQRIGLAAQLGPLRRTETVQYIRHRLAVAGRSAPVFTRFALRTVYRASGGVPRLINVICDKSLVLGYASDKKRIGRRIVRQVTRDWTLFRTPGRTASTSASPRQTAEHRIRRAHHRSPLGRIAAVAVVSLLATGLLAIRPGTPQRGAALGLSPASSPVPSPEAGRGSDPAPPQREAGASTTLRADVPSQSRPQAEEAISAGRPSADLQRLTPAASRADDRPIAVVTVRKGDTLSWLLYSAYGRVDDTMVDVVQLANPSLDDVDTLMTGQRLHFPPVEPAAMVHEVANGRYAVHLLTTSDPTHRRFRKLRADIRASGQTVRFEPVRLGTGCRACYRVWVGELPSRREAEAFYRRLHAGGAA